MLRRCARWSDFTVAVYIEPVFDNKMIFSSNSITKSSADVICPVLGRGAGGCSVGEGKGFDDR